MKKYVNGFFYVLRLDVQNRLMRLTGKKNSHTHSTGFEVRALSNVKFYHLNKAVRSKYKHYAYKIPSGTFKIPDLKNAFQ